MDSATFQGQIWQYYADQARVFPWRQTTDPYAIFLSEVMLQQTQTNRVEPKYVAFLEELPTFTALAQASTADVLRLWQGLGYNRRALALKRAGEMVVTEYAGHLPKEVEKVDELPGIGQATASAIVAFAYNLPTVFIETNIRRVFLHAFFPNQEQVHDRELLPLIETTLDRKNPREWYYALMDYGAMLAKAYPNPNRRSQHYTKQSTFAGSNRQLRGAIVRRLTKGSASLLQLVDAVEREPAEVEVCLKSLIKEGFLVQEGEYISIPL